MLKLNDNDGKKTAVIKFMWNINNFIYTADIKLKRFREK